MGKLSHQVLESITVAEFQNRDFGKVSEWCDHRGMKLNVSKIKTMIVSR